MNQALFISLLDRPIAYHRVFAKMAGSVNAGVMLSQAFYWSSRTKDPNGWFYKVQSEWEEETCLSRREQESARKQLRETGCWEERLIGIPAQLYYRLNLSALEAKLTYTAKINSLSMSENAILDSREAPSLEGGLRQTTICTESTSEITPLPAINAGELVLRNDSSMPQTKRRGRPPTPADPRHSEIIKSFSEAYERHFREKYVVSGRDAKHLQTFLRSCLKPTSEIMQIVAWCWSRMPEEYCPKTLKISAIWLLCHNWNSIMTEASKDQ